MFINIIIKNIDKNSMYVTILFIIHLCYLINKCSFSKLIIYTVVIGIMYPIIFMLTILWCKFIYYFLGGDSLSTVHFSLENGWLLFKGY